MKGPGAISSNPKFCFNSCLDLGGPIPLPHPPGPTALVHIRNATLTILTRSSSIVRFFAQIEIVFVCSEKKGDEFKRNPLLRKVSCLQI